RTPLGRRGGALSGTHPADLLGGLLRTLVDRTGIDPNVVDDVVGGCVMQVGEQSTNVTRNAWLAAGLPEAVPATTVDRQCGSSQQAVHFAAQGVIAGAYDVAVACGVESMSRIPLGANAETYGSPVPASMDARYDGHLVHQGISAELIAERWGISREEMDDFGARSHTLAGAAADAFAEEIVPTPGTDGALLTRDEGVRVPDREKMATLKPAFREDGLVTAGSSSQITDGAAALLITTPEKARELGLRPRARFHQFAVVGDDPVFMLTAPIPATRRVLERAGMRLDEMDAVEINEAFASVVLAWKRELGIDGAWFEEHVNPRGGAIALGHPVGASGARLMTTLLHHLEQTGGRFGLQTMCEGGGLANATIIERIAA
ncbi:MAG: acetyl-CoA C-acyltransferase, partial [Deltaproteobacteria bacterium]|nr:acetyl-CoA C-acyltransferase [Deltaproteobacteria bacterium]